MEQGNWFCPLGLWPLKGPIVTTWKGESALILGQPESPSLKETERFVEVLPRRLCVAQDDSASHTFWSVYFLDTFLVFCVWVRTHECGYLRSPEEGDKSRGAGVIDS